MQRLQPTRLPKPGESHERRGRQIPAGGIGHRGVPTERVISAGVVREGRTGANRGCGRPPASLSEADAQAIGRCEVYLQLGSTACTRTETAVDEFDAAAGSGASRGTCSYRPTGPNPASPPGDAGCRPDRAILAQCAVSTPRGPPHRPINTAPRVRRATIQANSPAPSPTSGTSCPRHAAPPSRRLRAERRRQAIHLDARGLRPSQSQHRHRARVPVASRRRHCDRRVPPGAGVDGPHFGRGSEDMAGAP